MKNLTDEQEREIANLEKTYQRYADRMFAYPFDMDARQMCDHIYNNIRIIDPDYGDRDENC